MTYTIPDWIIEYLKWIRHQEWEDREWFYAQRYREDELKAARDAGQLDLPNL